MIVRLFERIKNWTKFSIQAISFKDVTINANMHTRDFIIGLENSHEIVE